MSSTYTDRVIDVADSSGGGTFTETHVHRRISWGALFGGVVLVVAVQIVLSLLGASIGLNSINVNAGTTPSGDGFGIGAGLWWVISSCIALFVGGYAAAWLAGNEIRFDGLLHGLVTWGISTIVTLYLLTSAVGGLIGGGFSAIGSTAAAVGGSAKDAAAPLARATGLSPDVVQQQAQAYLQPTNSDAATMTPQDAQKDIAQNLVTYAQGGAGAPAAKARIIDVMAAQMKISRPDAATKFDDAQAKLNQAKAQTIQTAKNAADASASVASKTAFATFVDLLLGAIAAALGGVLAIRRRVLGSAHTVRTVAVAR